jgi:uncharacterized protein YciI
MVPVKKHDSGSTFVIAAEDLMEAFEDAGIDPRSPDAVWRLRICIKCSK